MSYQSSEQSVNQGKPRELYKFVGTYGNYYYTPQQSDITYDDGEGEQVYRANVFKRSTVKVGTQEDDGLDITIEMPVHLPLVKEYAFRISPPKLNLTIYRFHTLDDVKTYWKGPVASIRVSGGTAAIRCPSALSYALSGECPSVAYQGPCNRILYDEGCKVSRAANTINTTITAINDRVITLASNGGKPNNYFTAGELILPSGERRMIVAHTGNNITVNYPFAQLETGLAVQAVAGCDHAYEGDCLLKFDNQPNYGGFVFIPNENPFATGID